MRILLFYHSLLSDWNHGNAHFLRGIATELLDRGHKVEVYEPDDAWSLQNLLSEHGEKPLEDFYAAYPLLGSFRYQPRTFKPERVLDDADIVLVHEWNDPKLVRQIGEHRKSCPGTYRLYFHDTHHRMVTDPGAMDVYDLAHFDGVLAYGRVLRDLYLERGRAARAWTWHEAADTRIFKPIPHGAREGDLVWIGNWGDDERTAELNEFLFRPVHSLNLKAKVYGVRYPETARRTLSDAGIEYGGWLPNFRVPEVFSKYLLTVHVPRRPYATSLPGIPTIRPFEALACGIPMVSSPWDDIEGLFRPGKDFLLARDSAEMQQNLRELLHEPDLRESLAANGLETIRKRHTCAHRVDELLAIDAQLRPAEVPMNASSEANTVISTID